MRFRNSFRIFIDNFGNVYKLMLFRLVAGVLFVSAAAVTVDLGLGAIFSSAEVETLLTLLMDFVKAIFSGNTEFLMGFQAAFTEALGAFAALLGTHMGSIIGSVIAIGLLFLVMRFLNGTADFAAASVLNDKMEAYTRTKFFAAYFKNLAKAALYQVINIPVTVVYDLISLLLCWFFFLYAPALFAGWGGLTIFAGLCLALTAFLCLQAIKLTLFSHWIPSIITGKTGVAAGLRASLTHKKGFGGRFSGYLAACYLILAANVLLGFCTIGSALFFSVPASYLFVFCLQFVHYYEDTGRKFFLSFRKISGADGLPEAME